MGTCLNRLFEGDFSTLAFCATSCCIRQLASRAEASETLHLLNSVRAFPAAPEWPLWHFRLWETTMAILVRFKQNWETWPEVRFPTTFLNSYALLFAGVGITGAVRNRRYTLAYLCACLRMKQGVQVLQTKFRNS